MDMKKLYLANFNVTFGDKDDPLLAWLDEFVLPAMQMKIERTLSDQKSKAIDIEVSNNLTKAYEEVSMFCKEIEEMRVETPNIVEYEKYLQRRKMRDGSEK